MFSGNTPLGIIVGVDDSPAAKVAVQWAARDAELRNVALTLVHAVSPEIANWPTVRLPPGLARWQQDHGRRLLDDAFKVVEEVSERGGPAEVHSKVLSSAALPALVDLSKDAELVVTGSRGSGQWAGRPIGSVSSGLLRHAHCPVAIIHDWGHLPPADAEPSVPQPSQAPVLVGIDGSSASELATAIALNEASLRNVGLIALHAWSDADTGDRPEIDWPATQSAAEQLLAERLAGWQEQYPDVRIERIVVRDQPARQLVQRSEDAQLVVLGSRGRGGFAGLLVGSVSETVVQMTQVPVIVANDSLA